MASDEVAIAIALVAFGIVVWWWLYSLAQMRRDVEVKSTALKRHNWQRFTPHNGRYKVDIPNDHIAYRVYNSVVAFLHDHIDFGFVARGRGTDSKRDV